MSEVEVKRQMSTSDIAAVTALLDETSAADGRPALSDHLRLDLDSGGDAGFAGFTIREPGREIPYAYAQVSGGNESSSLEIVVRRDRRNELPDIGAELIRFALAVVAADGGGQLSWWVAEPTSLDRTLADDAGMHLDRTLLQMRRTLPADRDVTVVTRAFVPGSDESAWLEVNNRAFADHGEQGGWTMETLRLRQHESWFNPDGFRIHERDGRVAAFCWTKVHPPAAAGDQELGEIYVIAVDPDFHGLGLGTQLTLAGLEHLAEQGIATGLLYVDADNTTAVAMYERLGFEIHSTSAAFTIDIAPAALDHGQ
jgi:mycothiol synthase